MTFAEAAYRLAGQSALLLGWRPAEFWDATPADLHMVLHALTGADADSADQALLSALMEQFPDG